MYISKRTSLTVVDPFRQIPFDRVDFNDVIPLGEGAQGLVYAVIVRLEDDPEDYRYVVKRLKKKRILGGASSDCTSGRFLSSAASYPSSASIGTPPSLGVRPPSDSTA
jgi:hypothetical protein